MLAVTSFTLSYAAPWTQSASIRSASELRRSNDSFVPPVYTLDLDAPAATRWAHIAKDYTQYMPAVTDYFESVVPAWAVPIIEAIAGSVTSYFTDYGDEMEGLATALGVKKGEIVLLNLVMQIESLGLNCSNWNETAPTVPDDPGCMLIDPKQTWCYCHDAHRAGALRGDARDEFVEVLRRPVDAALHRALGRPVARGLRDRHLRARGEDNDGVHALPLRARASGGDHLRRVRACHPLLASHIGAADQGPHHRRRVP